MKNYINGNVVGNVVTTSAISASGVWGLDLVYNNLKALSFPGAIGTTSANAATSAAALVAAGGTVDGVYWINLPTVGPTQCYCLLNPAWNGGGYMMALKATTGSTFNYSSSYWNSNNTLNTTSLDQSNSDAKLNVYNYYSGTDLLARFPDITTIGGSFVNPVGGWVISEPNALKLYNGSATTCLNFWSSIGMTASTNYSAKGTQWGGGSIFSSQAGYQFYGFNYNGNSSNCARWGWGWNNETDQTSNDVTSGIGLNRANYSAGDYIACCADYSGLNRSMRVEIYVR